MDYIPVKGEFILAKEDSTNCIQLEIVRNGIATGTVDKFFQFKIWYEINTNHGNWINKKCRISIKNTDSK